MADATENISKTRKRKRSLWNKLVLLMWKNLLLRKRHWVLTAFEILLPTLLFTLLLTIRVLPDSAFLPSYVNESVEFRTASECVLKKELCTKYGFWSEELRRCFVPDNIDDITLPTLAPSVIDGLEGLNLTEADLSDPESILTILENVNQMDPESINLEITQSILENLDPCILERFNDTSFEGMGPAEILGILGSLLSNISLPEFPDGSNFSYPGERKIFYGPPGGFSRGVAEYLADVLRLGHHVLTPVTSNEDLDTQVDKSYFATNDSFAAFYIGLFFNDLNDTEVPPQHLKYDLRLAGLWFTDLLYPFLQIPGPRDFTILTESYGMDGFTLIQSLVDRYYISQVTGEPQYRMQYRLYTQMYPYPPYTQDYGMSQFYGSALPTFVVLSLVLLSPSLIKSVVYEKETGVRELIRLMGLERWLVWFGWFLHSFIIILVVSTIMTILLKLELTPMDDTSGFLPPIIIHTDPFFMWVLFVLYGVSSIAFCFAVSTFFSRPTLATTLGILLWLVSYFLPRQLMDFEYNDLGLAPKILSCFLPNMAITWAFRIIAMFEGRSLGVQWSRLWDTGNPRDQLTPAMVLIMLAVDTILYLFITWYVDHVSPGKYGVPLPWYFPFQRSYWCGASTTEDDSRGFGSESSENEYFEEEPDGLKPGITIKKLRKEFKTLGGKTKVAVEDVSLTCYEGQCTVLLGHNGAGKTTTMSVLTGVYAPSAGYAEVGGWDIATNLKKAREEIGLCPQHNMLFIDLTVLQHLLFFGRLKGMTTKDARKEAEELMQRLELKEKKNMFGNQLSGGMKRKLCLAIALIGGSKVVILDEPSSGLDPESRRWVWEVVQGERGRRTVLVTTHHMEEADVLGDRIAIMASGRVVCSGSTLFLKNKFGDGYTLTIMVSEDSSIKDIQTEVMKHLPEAALRSSQGGEVTFKLPPMTASFAPLLDSLTEQKEKMGIRHLGLSLTSMEQVFLRVGDFAEGADKESPQGLNGTLYDKININDDANNGFLGNHQQGANGYSSQRFLFNSQAEVDMRLTGWALLKQRIRAFFAKRMIYSKRKWVLLLTQGLLPVLITIMCLLVDASFNEETFQEPPRVLNLSMFTQSKSFVHAGQGREDLAASYQSLFYDPYEVEYADNLTDRLLAEADKDIFQYRENNICSADFEAGLFGLTTNMKTMYQSVPYHAPGVSTTMVTNALLSFATNSSNHSITTVNRPLPPNRTWKVGRTSTSGSAFVYAMVMPLALAFLSASFLVFPLEERETKAKQVQVMTGAPLWALWTTTFLWDLLTYTVSALAVFIFFMIMDSKDYFTVAQAPGALFLLLLLYGWGSIPMAYVFSFPFQTAASGFAVLALINIVAGEIITTAVWALDLSDQPDLIIVSDVLHWVTSLIPAYPASMAFMHLVDTSTYNTQCDQFNETVKEELCNTLTQMLPNNSYMICCPQCAEVGTGICFEKHSYFMFNSNGMGPNLLTLFINGVIFLSVLVLLESKAAKMLKSTWWRIVTRCSQGKASKTTPAWELTQDNDVAAEADLVRNVFESRQAGGGLDDSTLLVSSLKKQFLGAPRPAVSGVSFRVAKGECLGLLGVNGAGKTTTFRMLTGDEEPSSGDAMVDNISLHRDKNKFVQQIGYCPQFDAVLGELTAIEMLTLVGRLRGVSDARMKRLVNELVTLVGLTECALRPSSTYSGGNRRKLSTAMALVGSPQLVFLDEPTSGVDPASRRRVWTAVTKAINNGQSVVLTSHSMEECEALCSRIIIMSRGTLRCVGTTSHLKAKFGQGYSLQIKLRTHGLCPKGATNTEDIYTSKVQQVKSSISYYLPGAVIIDQHKGMLSYRIPTRISWGRLFSVMEALKSGRQPSDRDSDAIASPVANPQESIVEDYAASDTSLEQVFLTFAREASGENQNKDIPQEVVTKL